MDNNFEEKMREILKAVGIILPGTVTHISVKHDDDCPTLRTGNFTDCTCSPVIKKMQAQ